MRIRRAHHAERSAPEQQFTDSKLDEGLPEFGLSPDSALRKIVDKDVQVFEGSGITGQQAYGVTVVRQGVPHVTIRERLAELRDNFMHRDRFPAEGPTISANDMKSLRENFSNIASGNVTVR